MTTFDITPRQGKAYFTCHVFENEASMYEWYQCYCDDRGTQDDKHDFLAIVLQCERIAGGERLPFIGSVLLCRGSLGTGVVAHEMLHCALWYDRIINGNRGAEYGEECGEAEERLALLLTDLCRETVNKLYELKFL